MKESENRAVMSHVAVAKLPASVSESTPNHTRPATPRGDWISYGPSRVASVYFS